MLSDTTLLIQACAGDAASFEALFLRHYECVYKVLFYLLGNQADAEDIAQQIFLKLYHAPERIQSPIQSDANVAGWLYRAAINEGYNALRSRKRRTAWYEKLARLWPLADAWPDPARQAESQDIQAQVRQILLEMKPRQAQLLLLRHSGFSYAELAMALGVAPGSIGSLLTRAERAFAQKYRRAFPEEA
jgi:RNA polymerase sigma-70 factor (ECF subfamily)